MAYTTLRMYEPACKVDSRWCFQKLNPQILNLLERLSYMFQTGMYIATGVARFVDTATGQIHVTAHTGIK